MSDAPDDSIPFDPEEVCARWPGIPLIILEGLARYFNHHLPVGGFLACALRNDFAGAVLHADPESLAALRQIAGALTMMPSSAWGSPVLVARWLAATWIKPEDGR